MMKISDMVVGQKYRYTGKVSNWNYEMKKSFEKHPVQTLKYKTGSQLMFDILEGTWFYKDGQFEPAEIDWRKELEGY